MTHDHQISIAIRAALKLMKKDGAIVLRCVPDATLEEFVVKVGVSLRALDDLTKSKPAS